MTVAWVCVKCGKAAGVMRECDDEALRFNPWGDDDSDYRVLSNRMVCTRYSHECAICFDSIPPGVTARAQREVCDRRAKTFYFCPNCCHAMRRACRARTEDDELAVERRRYVAGRILAERRVKS